MRHGILRSSILKDRVLMTSLSGYVWWPVMNHEAKLGYLTEKKIVNYLAGVCMAHRMWGWGFAYYLAMQIFRINKVGKALLNIGYMTWISGVAEEAGLISNLTAFSENVLAVLWMPRAQQEINMGCAGKSFEAQNGGGGILFGSFLFRVARAQMLSYWPALYLDGLALNNDWAAIRI